MGLGGFMKNELFSRNGKLIYIRQPEYNELKYTHSLWNDYETMKDIGGVFEFGEEKWSLFYKKMINPTDGKNFYCLVFNNDDEPVGEVSFHGYDSATKVARLNVKIHNKHRNRGYGTEACRLLLEYFFFDFGGNIAMDTLKGDKVIESIYNLGFSQHSKCKGEITYQISRESFLNNRRAEVYNVGFILYDRVENIDFIVTYEYLNKCNNYLEYRLFNTFTLGESHVTSSSGLVLEPELKLEEVQDINVLVIPGGVSPNDKYIIKKIASYIKVNYKKLDYILCIGGGVLFLAEANMLINTSVTTSKEYVEIVESLVSTCKVVDKPIVDNGRIVFSSGGIENTGIYSVLIKKLLGEEKANEILENIK